MEGNDIRWKQRFENFEKAFGQLDAAVQKFDSLDDLSKEGLVQRFEYTFELAWKTLKDFLESQGEEVKFAREVIKKAFYTEIITDGELWLDMLQKRNLMAHTYNESYFHEVVNTIVTKYFTEVKQLVSFFKAQL